MKAAIGLRRRVATILLATVLAGLGTVVLLAPGPAVAASKCTALTKSVHLFVNAERGVNVLTYNSARFAGLKKNGYADRGVIFKAGNKKKGLTAVHVMYDKRNGDRIYTTSNSEIKALKKKGYRDHGTGFSAYPKSASCLYPVYRLHKGRLHRFALTAADRSALKKQGWTEEKKVFWVARPPASKPPKPTGDTKFSIAVLPDTQQEVLGLIKPTDTRFANRTQWLVSNSRTLDLRFVTHTGDIVNWDTPDHNQYKIAANAMGVLGRAGIPYSMSPGNHDTAAVCPGGSGCPNPPVTVTVRNTTTFNAYLGTGKLDLVGQFERGKMDNAYYRFDAGGLHWLVLNLELWPRVAVVNWAKQVVASHPHDNVMVVTHSYLNGDGTISTVKDYGATSPKYLYDNLISRYANVRLVFSGHVGTSAHRSDKGVHGNRIDSFLLAMHSNSTNPVRLIEIDTGSGSLRSWVYAPYTPKASYPAYTTTLSKLSWVR